MDSLPERPGYIKRLVRNITKRLKDRGYFPAADERDSTAGTTDENLSPALSRYQELTLSSQRQDIYRDMDEIDDTMPEGSRALDVLADNAVNAEGGGLYSFIITVEGSKSYQRLLDDMVTRTRLREKIYAIARDAAKYGDNFQQIVISDRMRIERLMYMPADSMRRFEDSRGLLRPGNKEDDCAFGQYEPGTGTFIAGFYPWQIEHLRWNRSGSTKYGRAQLLSARYAWKKLQAMQEALVINWLTRAFVRLLFELDVTGKKPQESQQYLREFMKQLERRTVASGAGDDKPLSVAKDIALGNSYINLNGTWQPALNKVSVLDTSNSGFWNITAIEYWRNKFVSATGVPKAHIGIEQDINAKCVALDTKIPLLRGETVTLQDIITEYETTGLAPWVLSWDDKTGRIVPGQVTWAGVTKRQVQLVAVELDDGAIVRTTPDHRFYDIHGNEVEARDLRRGQQLLPLRMYESQHKNYHGYIKVKDPYGNIAVLHRRVAETLWPDRMETGTNVHHIDRDKRNNEPNNLSLLTFDEHLAAHGTDRFETISKYCVENGPWNRGVTKDSDDPRAASLRPITYIQKPCENCGEDFTLPLTLRRHRFCSKKCAAEFSARARAAKAKVTVQCDCCGKEFVTTTFRIANGRGRFCSILCRAEGLHRRKQTEKVCAYCGEPFMVYTTRGLGRQFCSKRCSNTFRNKQMAGLVPVPNHRVRQVTRLTEVEDTGDITVDGWHNFFVADASGGGVLVHNSTLQWQDERFSRTVRRIQSMLSEFLSHLVSLELVLQGIDPQKVQYKIEWAPPSTMDQLEKAQALQAIATAAGPLLQLGVVDQDWLRINALRMTPTQSQALAHLKVQPPVEKPAPPADKSDE